MKNIDYSKAKKYKQQEPLLLTSISAKLIPTSNEISYHLSQKIQVVISTANLQKELKCYEWRIKTQFPIIKINNYKIIKKDGLKSILSITYQNYPIRLTQLKQIPLFKILYLLKQSIIGFQRLYNKFGSFRITSSMIAISQQNKCKIWMNQNFVSNQYFSINISEKQFLQIIYKIFIQVGNKLRNTAIFFKELYQSKTFCQALNFIENYARENKITIPNTCKIIQKELNEIGSKAQNNFNPSLTMTRSPKFLSSANLRGSLKPSTKILLDPIISQAITKQIVAIPDSTIMKISGDTAADIYGSNTQSYSNKTETQCFDESIIFGQDKLQKIKKIQPPLKFSKSIKKFSLTRQLSDISSTNSYFGSSIKLSPPHHRIQIPNLKSYREVESQCESDGQIQTKEAFKESVRDIFKKNKWQKQLNGLFSDGCDLKTSTHHGQEKKKASKYADNKLLLLESVSGKLHQSFINEDNNL